jgi:hypothetical protein
VRRRWPLLLAVVAGTALLWAAGLRALPGPPLAHPAAVATWWKHDGLTIAIFASVRWILLLMGTGALVLVAAACSARVVFIQGRRGVDRAQSAAGWAARWGRTRGRRAVIRLVLGVSASGVTLTAVGSRAALAVEPGSGSSASTRAPVLVGPASTGGSEWTPGPLAAPLRPNQVGPAPVPPESAPESPPESPPGSTGSTGSRPTATRPTFGRPEPFSTPSAPVPSSLSPPPATPTTSGPPTTIAPAPPLALSPATTLPEPGPLTGPSPPPGTLQPTDRAAVPTDAAPEMWTVAAGDDFWSVAEAVLSRSSGTPVPASAVGPYWARLVAANRSRLPRPDDPSLLFPGDVLVVPPP